MTSCMSSKRSNQLSYASKALIVYHTFFHFARGFRNFFEFFKKYFLCRQKRTKKPPNGGFFFNFCY